MIPTTAVGLIIAALALLPGAAYVWSYESQTGSYGVTLSDRIFRFLGVSAVVQVLAAWPEYAVYRMLSLKWPSVPAGSFALAWGLFVVIITVPAIAGTVTGRIRRCKAAPANRLGRLIFSGEIAPRAWDHIFVGRPAVFLRVRTADDHWIGGRFSSGSYAGGFPNEKDLRLEETYRIDPVTKNMCEPLGYGTYIPESSISWIEILEPERNE